MDGKRESYKWELLALLCLAFFFNQGDRAIFGVVLPSIKAELHLTDTQLGLVGSVLFFTLASIANTHAALFDVIAPCHRASAVGIMSMCAFLLGSVSPWLLGWLRGVCPAGTGLSYGFVVLAAAYLIGGAAVGAARRFTFENERYREIAA